MGSLSHCCASQRIPKPPTSTAELPKATHIHCRSLPKRAFTDLMRMGPHLLAPTGTDLEKHGRVGAVVAGCHYDLNFLTIHGRSRFPGLHIWLRDGRRVPVAVPEGCLLVQVRRRGEKKVKGEGGGAGMVKGVGESSSGGRLLH